MTPRVDRSGNKPLELLDAGMSLAARLPADVRIAGHRQDFDLPVWLDNEGDLRIGLPKPDPQHAADFDQIIVSLGDLLKAVGAAASDEKQGGA